MRYRGTFSPLPSPLSPLIFNTNTCSGRIKSIAHIKPQAATGREDDLLEYLEDDALVEMERLQDESMVKLQRLPIVEKEKSVREQQKREAEDYLRSMWGRSRGASSGSCAWSARRRWGPRCKHFWLVNILNSTFLLPYRPSRGIIWERNREDDITHLNMYCEKCEKVYDVCPSYSRSFCIAHFWISREKKNQECAIGTYISH